MRGIHTFSLGLAIIASLVCTSARAAVVDASAISVTVGGATGAGVIGTPVAGFAVGGALGTAELGYFTCVAILGIGDPPDLINYGVKANPALLVPIYAADPTASNALNAASFDVVNDSSLLIQNLRAIFQTRDRLAGATLVGTAQDVANQQAWLQEFMSIHHSITSALGGKLHSYNTLLQVDFPSFSAMSVSVSDMKAMRDLEASGVFTTNEQIAIAGWQLTSDELDLISGRIGQVTDATIDLAGPMSVSEAIDSVADNFCPVPEPSTLVMSSILIGMFGTYTRMGNRKKKG
jgi:hypothetical protein